MLLDEIQRSQTSETERCEGICITPMQFQALKKVSFLQEHHVVVEYNLDGMLKILLPTNLQILFFFQFYSAKYICLQFQFWCILFL